MSSFSQMVHFVAEDGKNYFADLGPDANGPPPAGTQVEGFPTFENLTKKTESHKVTVSRVLNPHHLKPKTTLTIHPKLLAPLPYENIPIYCVGLNYHSHAKEADVRLQILA